MSSYEGKNFFEVLGAFVPGYKGYKEQQTRRDCDRVLRDAVVKRLLDRKPMVDQLMAGYARAMQFDQLHALESIKKKMEAISEQVKHAPRGYSGFFDTVQVKNEDLDRLYRHDMGLRDKVEEFTNLLGAMSGAKDVQAAAQQVLTTLQELSEIVRHRDQAITEVK